MLSDQQEAIIQAVRDALASGKRSGINVIARAGCGKTYTLEQIAKAVPDVEMQFLAYNKAIADELKGRGLRASTVHGAGYGAWKRMAPDCKMENDKVSLLLEALQKELREKAMVTQEDSQRHLLQNRAAFVEDSADFVKETVSKAKGAAFGFLCSFEDTQKWFALVEYYGLDDLLEGDLSSAIRLCIEIYRRSLAQDHELVDYDDMLLAPLVHNARIWPKRLVLLDEAQDTNPARRAIALKMLAKNGVLVAVGDPRQAIYGFTGADSNSMDLIRDQLGSKELSLTRTYRCGKAIVEAAQRLVPDFEANDANNPGKVDRISALPSFESSDAVLCRNTKPLVELAFSLLRKGIPCKVEGREIGNGLIALASRWKVKTLAQLRARLDTYRERETGKFLAKGQDMQAQNVEDKVESLLILMTRLQEEGKQSVSDLVSSLSGMFSDNIKGILTLSTIHKSKGREWKHVYILGANAYMPSPYAKKAWEKGQEENLMYVAITRAIEHLTFIEVRKA